MISRDAVGLFQVALAGEASSTTRRWYRQRLKSFVAFAGETQVGKVTAATVRASRAELFGRRLGPHTAQSHLRALRRS